MVTGAAGGIGRRLTTRLLAMGNTVVATDINKNMLQKAYEEEWASNGFLKILYFMFYVLYFIFYFIFYFF